MLHHASHYHKVLLLETTTPGDNHQRSVESFKDILTESGTRQSIIDIDIPKLPI